jgi:hypothetical protein
MRARGVIVAVVAALALAGGSAREAASRTATCDGASATINQAENVASTTVTLTASLHNQGCNVAFVFYLLGPNGTITTPEYHPPAQADGKIALPASGLEPGTTYLVKGRLWDRLGDWPVYDPNTGEVTFRTLARLDVFKRGQGTVVSTPAAIDCGAICGVDLPVGGGLSLTATPDPGYRFGHWEGDACSGAAPTCAAWVTTWTRTTAVFDQASLVTVTRSGTGSGSVASTPAGLACGAACSATFDPGRSLSLTATADAGSRFAGWSGACTGADATCTFTPGVGAASVDAAFVKLATLTVRRRGRGIVRDEAGKIACGVTCVATVDDGSSTTLRAKPSRGYRFAGWTGACTGKTLVCSVRVSGPTAVGATFKAKPRKKKPKR